MKNLWVLLCCFLLPACAGKKTSDADGCQLQATGEVKSFELDSDVRYNAFYLYTFADKEGKQYLSFLNYRTNQLLFYDWESGKFLFKVKLDAEGPDGVTQVSGYSIRDFQHMYVSTYAYNGLIQVDTTGHIVRKIPYGTTAQGYKVLPSYTPSSHPYTAPVLLDDGIYITQPANQRFNALDKTPLTVRIDTARHLCEGMPATYALLTDEEKEADNTQFSRQFDGRNFIYSFYVSEDILVASPDHSEVKRIKAKSRYIGSSTEKQADTDQGPRLYLELARYGDLVYDPYREVYYRFAYPKVSLDPDVNWWGKAVYGRKKFSVMVLDKDFRLLGETLFPEGIYNSFVFLVHEDGLYISRDYRIGTAEQSEDYLTFERFELAEE